MSALRPFQLRPFHRALIVATFLLASMASADRVVAGPLLPIDKCRIYGFPPHSRAYAECRMNVRRFWTTGPCADPYFAGIHREYCHLYPPPFI